MSCEERKELLALVAAGALDDADAAPLLAHLEAGCPQCAGAWAEANAMLAQLPFALDPVAPSPELRQRLMAKVQADAQAHSQDVTAVSDRASSEQVGHAPPPVSTPRSKWWQPWASAAAAALITFFLVSTPLRRQQVQLDAEVARQAAQIRQLEQAVREANSLVQVLRSPEMLLVAITGTENQPQATGRILWDRDRNYWHLSVAGMQPAPAGKTYELWFVTAAEEKISAGTFDAGPDGEATLLVEIPEGLGQIVLAAVTDEPQGGSVQPTGAFQLLGQVPRDAA